MNHTKAKGEAMNDHEHIFNIDLGDPCVCGSDNCYACECGEEKHD